MSAYLRGEIAKLANVHAETLRYYEDMGLIPLPSRSPSGYRLYPQEVLARLDFIRNAKSCGFSLKEVKKALNRSEAGELSLDDFMTAIDRKADRIRSEIARNEATLTNLDRLKANLQAAQRHPKISETLRVLHMES